MHWNVAPDALPGSVSLVLVLDRWLNDWDVVTFSLLLIGHIHNLAIWLCHHNNLYVGFNLCFRYIFVHT